MSTDRHSVRTGDEDAALEVEAQGVEEQAVLDGGDLTEPRVDEGVEGEAEPLLHVVGGPDELDSGADVRAHVPVDLASDGPEGHRLRRAAHQRAVEAGEDRHGAGAEDEPHADDAQVKGRTTVD